MDTRTEIREFLTTRRARLSPEQAGLPVFGGQRRVPGLRREEVAMLAGVSTDYYTRLERGNLSGVSESVLEALARGLQLDDAERAHLFDLARAAGPIPRARRRPTGQRVRPSVQRILDAMDVPAVVQNGRLDILSANALGYALYSETGLAPGHPVNYARFVFLDDRSQRFYLEWDHAADDTVALLRAEAGRDPYDRNLSDLVGELATRSEPFRIRWAAHNVTSHQTSAKRLHHPVVGDLTLNFDAMALMADHGLLLLAFSAEPGSKSEEALRPARQLVSDTAAGAQRVRRRFNMEYRPLGRTGVSVSELCLGTMMFGAWGNPDHEDSIRIIHRALDAGVNFVDTADVYSAGESEEIVGKALKGRRDDVVLATKVHVAMSDDPNHRGNSRRWIITEAENSLRRLGTDWIDLYQIHRPDPATDIEETLGALSDLVTQGKVRYIGSSSFSASQIVEAQWVSHDRRLQRFRTEQPPYSLLVRGIEADVLPTASRHGMGILSYSPLAGGWLSGRWRADARPTSPARARLVARFDMSLPENQRKLEAAEALAQLAEEIGVSLIELAIAFVVNHPAVTSAIIGPRTLEQLESQLPAADVVLDAAVLDRIDAIVSPGTNLNPADTSYAQDELAPAARRR